MLQLTHPSPRRALRIANWRLDTSLDELSLGDITVKLEPRMTRVLLMLAERPGELVTATELMNHVWQDLTVTQSSLYQVIAQLRRIMRADSATETFIATVARKGYRLVAPIEWAANDTGNADEESDLHGPCSVAVLPFRVGNLATAHDFVVEVLLDDLIAELSRYPMLAVISRGTMLTYRERIYDPRSVAGELGVRFVVEGRIIVADGGLEIGVRLTDTSSNILIWSDSEHTSLERCLTSGRDAMGRFARDIQFRVVDETVHQTLPQSRGGEENRTAFRAWVELYCRPQTRQTNDRAWEWALEALESDSSSAVAWNALAYCEWRAAIYGWADEDQSLMDQALGHVQRAIMLGPRNPDAHYTHALIAHTSREHERAEAALHHCLALNPSYAPAIGLLGLIRLVQGQREQALVLCERAFTLSPYEPLRVIWHCVRAWAALEVNDAAAALAHAQHGLAVNPDYPMCHITAAVAANRAGNRDLAARCIAHLRSATAFSTLSAVRKRLPIICVEPYCSQIPSELRDLGMPDE